MRPVLAIEAAVSFVWLGMVLAISFLETPLKFRAPGVTVPLAVGIGRLVFRALNIVEAVLAAALVACLFIPGPEHSALAITLIAALVLVLAAGALLVRPAMDRRVRQGQISEGVPRGHLHLWYVALESLKLPLLIAIGVTALTGPA